LRRVWITRAAPGAEATAVRVRALGWEPVVAPVLQVRFLSPFVDLTGVGALAFTSANGVRAFARQTDRRDPPVFAVGQATAAAAREAGFADVRSAEGDVAALGRAIVAHRSTFSGVILHPGAAEPAGDLRGDLERAGLRARAQALYETAPLVVPEDFLAGLGTLAESRGARRRDPRGGSRPPSGRLWRFRRSPGAAEDARHRPDDRRDFAQ